MFVDTTLTLEDRLIDGAGLLAAAHCRWLTDLGELDEQQGDTLAEFASTAAWVSWRCGVPAQLAKEYVSVAQALRKLPGITAEFFKGRLSYSQVRLLVRVATENTEQTLIYVARNSAIGQLAHVVSVYRSILEAEEAAQARHNARGLYTWFDSEGFLILKGRLCPEDGAIVQAALEQAQQALKSADPRNVSNDANDSYAAAQADALVYALRGTTRSGIAEIVLHADLATLTGVAGEGCHLESGVALAPSCGLRLSCDAALVGLIEDDQGNPLSVGRRTRTIPTGMRRALSGRDQGCRFPGCLHTRFLDGHHIKHWAQGGETSLENLIELCTFHHRLVHEGGYLVKPAQDGFEFFRTDGSVVPAVAGLTGNFSSDYTPAIEISPQAISSEWLGDRMNMQYVLGALIEAQSQGP